MAGRLGDIMVRRGWITENQLQAALAAQGSERGLLGAILVRRNLISVAQLGEASLRAIRSSVPRDRCRRVNPQVARLLPEDLARSREMVAIDVVNHTLHLAMVAPDDIEAISEAELITGYHIEPVVALVAGVQAALDRGFDDRIVARQTIVDMKMADLAAAEDHIDDDIDRGVVG